MIVYLVTADHAYTLNRYLQEWAPELAEDIQPIFYEESPWEWLDLEATYIFSDIERLDETELQHASSYADFLVSKGYRVLNHPDRAPTRLALQKLLNDSGINPFRMFPVKDHPNPNFPVFLRLANSHQGSIGELIHSQMELDSRLASLDEKIASAADLVIVEYCDTRDSSGRFVKYSAMQVGKRLVPRHALSSKQWMLKVPDIVDEQAVQIESHFLHDFPQRDALENIFSVAKIDFGRVDFGLQDGEIRVWEINTNPTFMPMKKGLHPARADVIQQTSEWLMNAFRSIDNENYDVVSWQRVSKRHILKRKMWWLQRKLFRRKRA
ncbi:MAG: hypothetical protein ACREO1_02515 [Arenimonas sp.]